MYGPTLLAETRQVARKYHRCFDCGGWIAPGERYSRVNLAQDGSAYTLLRHIDCVAMSDEVVTAGHEPDYWYDGVPPLWEDEGVMDDLDLWRGYYPHVVCRIEFRKQIAELRYQDRLRNLGIAADGADLDREEQ